MGRRAVVTGASSGIGRAIALAFAREGASVAIGYRANAAGAEETARAARELGVEACLLAGDIARDETAERLVEHAFSALGGVDCWVNNAGADLLTGASAELGDAAKLDLALAVDLRATVLVSCRVAERMRAAGRGVMLNVSWDHVAIGAKGRVAEIYAAAKGGVLAFSKSLARSFAPEVRVNVLAPGWIETGFAQQLPEARRRAVREATPLGRFGAPQDVAAAATFLASDEASFLTGATLLVNGGVVM